MKTIFMGLFSLFLLVNIGFNQEEKTVKATYNGYEDGVYSFSDKSDEDEVDYEFEKVSDDVLKAFDLKGEKFLNKTFKITYKENSVNDEDIDEVEVWTIVKLELIK
jgi:hypothetical protein